MTRDELAVRVIVASLANPYSTVRLENPRPLTWTTNPPPAIYTMVENALWIADSLLTPKKEEAPE